MKYFHLPAVLLFITTLNAFAQGFNPLAPPNTYQDKGNPYYWKNRKPHTDYWQQDVHYIIKADLNDSTDIIDAQLELIYQNNSPDTLTFVFFHLYQNAFQPGSYYHNLVKANKKKPRYGRYESAGKGTEIEHITVSGSNLTSDDAYEPDVVFDNTIMKVNLKKPLQPGQRMSVKIKFKTYFDTGSERRRMKTYTLNGYKHFDGVHWYPRISVYDRKFGWDTYQHLGKEFYGDFGCFDVELTLPEIYIAEATGWLQNESEVLPDELKQKLRINNFKYKPMNSKPSQMIVPSGNKKTWKYHAENVHDFAFTADPAYRIGEAYWNNIKCVALAREEVAARWQDAASYTARVIETFSRDFGMYAYPKIVVADARDGMEYPMLTLCGGYSPNYYSLFAHEVGHNWFMGMVGTNETYRALLDEGFTQFITAWGCQKILGDTIKGAKPESAYSRMFTEPQTYRFNHIQRVYIDDAMRGNSAYINTASDMFNSALGHGGGYRQVYYKTANMLLHLQSVLGTETFLGAMQFYFNRWKICHPYVEDFRQAVTDYTKSDLNWFFDQWIETDKTLDMAIGRIKKTDTLYQYRITLLRNEGMQSPVDLQITAKDGNRYNFYIPNTWFRKKTKATTLPAWQGWDKLNSSYTATVTIPTGIKQAEIDPEKLCADINRMNNRSCSKTSMKFDSHISGPPDWDHYVLKIRPDFWGNGYDGLKVGVHLNGSYFGFSHNFSLSAWYNTGLAQDLMNDGNYTENYDLFSYNLSYATPLNGFIRNSVLGFNARYLDGLQFYLLKYAIKSRNESNTITIALKSMKRKDKYASEYVLDPTQWEAGYFNNSVRLGFEHRYTYPFGNGTINLNAVSTALWSDLNYGYIEAQVINRNRLARFEINTRGYGRIGYENSPANESSLYLSGANPEEMMDNKYIRSYGFFPRQWAQQGQDVPGNFQHGGGLNLRGYAGYAAPDQTTSGELVYTYRNTTGLSANVELEFDKYLKIRPAFTRNWLHFDTYLFADAGIINSNYNNEKLSFNAFRADAGAGIALSITKFGALQNIEPLVIRFDMPFYLSNAPAADPENFKFRWVVGVQKSF